MEQEHLPSEENKSRLERTNAEKEKKKKAKKVKPKKSVPRRIFKGVLVTGITLTTLTLAGTGIGGAYAWNKYGDMVQSSVTNGYSIAEKVKATDFVTKSPTKIVDKDGKVLKVFKEYQYETPKYKDINPIFVNSLVSAEDERFYDHHGVDLYGTLRGIATTLKGNGVQGGSTITQQLVKNVILQTSEQTVERKLTEQVVAQELEKTMTKDEIIRHYLNNVYFGNGNYGIAPASRYYFSKSQKDIKLHEAATIVGITNNPSLFDPVTHPENALKKRNRVLGKMLEVGSITKKEHDEAVKKPLGIKVTKHGIDNSVTEPALGYAVHKATEHLMEKEGFAFQYIFDTDEARSAYKQKYHEEYVKVRQAILNGGYYIETSIDPVKQKKLQEVVRQGLSQYQAKDPRTGFYKTQTAITTVDNKTGEVVAIVGGRGEEGDVFNRGFQGIRQPGSTIKPLVAYTPAFEKGYTPESRMADSYVKNGPKNYYLGYRGNVTLRYATEISINTIPFKLANQIGGKAMVEKLGKMKFSNLTKQDANPIISVGGFTYGTTTVEMASAYATIANQGIYKEPTNIRKIKDIVTNDVLFKKEPVERKVYESGASYLMVDTLKGVMKSGTGSRAMPRNYPHVIGKTGTTNASKDIWFLGASPYYTTAVWFGYDNPSSIPQYDHWVASTLFRSWNEELHKGKKVVDFKRPDTVWKQNGHWVASVNKVEQERASRKYLETLRRQNESSDQKERLALEDYRILHGLTKEEEDARESAVTKAFKEFFETPFEKLKEYDDQLKMLKDIKPLIEEVKHKKAYDEFIVKWDSALLQLNGKKESFLAEIERKRLEEERKKREAEEAKRLEEERRIQAEVDRRLEEERIKKEAEEAKQAQIEEEERKKREAENPVQEEVDEVDSTEAEDATDVTDATDEGVVEEEEDTQAEATAPKDKKKDEQKPDKKVEQNEVTQ